MVIGLSSRTAVPPLGKNLLVASGLSSNTWLWLDPQAANYELHGHAIRKVQTLAEAKPGLLPGPVSAGPQVRFRPGWLWARDDKTLR